MDTAFLISALGILAVCTSLTVEGIKKILDSVHKTFNATILAVIVSFVLSIASSIGYMIYTETQFTPRIGVEIAVLVFLSFLCSTVGYDKVIKEIFKHDN